MFSGARLKRTYFMMNIGLKENHNEQGKCETFF